MREDAHCLMLIHGLVEGLLVLQTEVAGLTLEQA